MLNTQLPQDLMDFINASPSMFHATSACQSMLADHDFMYLDPKENWHLTQGGKYYTTSNDSSLIAFSVNTLTPETDGFKIVAAHTDVPGFRIKPNPQMKSESYIKLNTEVYGGPILNTWFDRPLSIAGRASYKSKNPLFPHTTLVNLERPLLIIPNLAIHMNRDVNTGVNYNKQKDTLPILTYIEENLNSDYILELVADKIGINAEDILDMDLYLYPVEKGCLVGLHEDFISSPRLDDLSMVYSGIYGLLNSTNSTGISMMVCFDNEEIGSHTKQGADSPFLSNTIERIMLALNKQKEDFFRAVAHSFMISADVAHLYHPNYTEKSDPTNPVLPGHGPAIKSSANFSYTTDSDSAAVFKALCKSNNIPYQIFVNRSDMPGGSTIGPVSASQLAIRSIDIGTPMLSMHSARELMATADFIHTCNVLKAFYSL